MIPWNNRSLWSGLVLLLVWTISAPPVAAERATELEMANVAWNWLAYNIHLQGAWSGAANPTILGSRPIRAEGRLVGRSFAVEPRGHIVVPILKEMPPVKSYSQDYGLDLDQAEGYPRLIREVLADRARWFEERYGSLDAVQTGRDGPLFDPVNRTRWDRFARAPAGFDRWLIEAPGGSRATVGPLLTSTWHQGDPYNDDCPMGDGGRCVVGCVATATAQIMNYHQHPTTGQGSNSYWWDGDDSCGGSTAGQTLAATFTDTYDWANILDSYSGGSTPTQDAAVAELCYEVGVAFEMDYGHCGSGAWTAYAATVLPTYFRYQGGIVAEDRTDHTFAAWFSLIQTDINASRPMLYRLLTSGGGHAIVCDGWRDDSGSEYHMNYGWGGSYNGWYFLDNLYDSTSLAEEYLVRNIRPDSLTPTATPTPRPGEDCGDPEVLACPTCVTGSTVGYTNDVDFTCGGYDDCFLGPDRVYQFTLGSAQSVTIRGEADYDADWGLASVCSSANPDQFCLDVSAGHVDPSCGSVAHVDWSYLNETLSLSAGTYYLWVDGYGSREGNFALEVICTTPATSTPTRTPTGGPVPVPAAGTPGLALLVLGLGALLVKRRRRSFR